MKHLSGYSYGEVLRDTSVPGFRLTETAYMRSLKLPKHSHARAYFCFVLRGNFAEVYGKGSRSCRPSTLVFHPAGEIHSDHFHTPARCFNIQIDDRWLERVRQCSSIIEKPADFCDDRLAHLAAGLYREFRNLGSFSSLVIEGLTLEIIAETSRQLVNKAERVPPRWLKQAREILHERFGEYVTLVALAETVDVHPAHLAREFRRFYRCTIGDYVRQQRIEFTCRQISDSDAPLSEIALAAGFFDQSHFARTFKAYTGMTPRQYRTFSSSCKSDATLHTLCKS